MADLKVAISTDPPQNIVELTKYILSIQNHADFLHFDIMDGNFVEKTTYEYKTVKFINNCTTLPIESHLMISNPNMYIKRYIDAGSNVITVHFETYSNINKLILTIKKIQKYGALAGVSIKPNTPVEKLLPLLPLIDLVLIMSVEPGKSGQAYLECANDKIAYLKQQKIKNSYNFIIEVDGGIDAKISQKVHDLGADIIVSGSYVYNSANKKLAIQRLTKKNA